MEGKKIIPWSSKYKVFIAFCTLNEFELLVPEDEWIRDARTSYKPRLRCLRSDCCNESIMNTTTVHNLLAGTRGCRRARGCETKSTVVYNEFTETCRRNLCSLLFMYEDWSDDPNFKPLIQCKAPSCCNNSIFRNIATREFNKGVRTCIGQNRGNNLWTDNYDHVCKMCNVKNINMLITIDEWKRNATSVYCPEVQCTDCKSVFTHIRLGDLPNMYRICHCRNDIKPQLWMGYDEYQLTTHNKRFELVLPPYMWYNKSPGCELRFKCKTEGCCNGRIYVFRMKRILTGLALKNIFHKSR